MDLVKKIKNLPNSAGIYQYFDENGKLLYIGKAKDLKKRVKSYFSFTPTIQPAKNLSYRITKMVSEIKDLAYIVVDNEVDALILENSLIKQLRPKYNILLRDDKTYPYIYIDFNEEFPRLDITRKLIKKKNIKYFGPYTSGAKDILKSIYELVPLVQKKGGLKHKQLCLFYQIKRCLGPCENKISKKDYQLLIDTALEYIYNKQKLISKLKQKMKKLSDEFRFEEALELRDRIANIKQTQIASTIDLKIDIDIDLFAIKIVDNKAIILKMFIRDGKIISTTHNILAINESDIIQEIYKRAIFNYYSKDLPSIPKEILIKEKFDSISEIEQFLYNKYNKKISIKVPKIGNKKRLVEIAEKNIDEIIRVSNKQIDNICISIKELFELDILLNRFEVIDNSQLMGENPVGAVIVYENNKFIKEDYRLYNLHSTSEYEQMKEILTRRVQSFEKNPPPDMIVIDGGETLLKLAYDIINSSGANVELVAIAKEKINSKAHRAKGKAKDLLYYITKKGDIKLYKLPPSDKRLHFFQKLRDEAHRVAINFFKKQKLKKDSQISLLKLKGIGEAKIKKMLNYFGSFSTIQRATLEELKVVLNEKDAKIVKEYTSTIKQG